MSRTLDQIMEEQRVTHVDLAKILGIARSTLYRKLKSQSFKPEEIRKMSEYLKITDAREIYDIFLC